jgi:hypothetical protein
MKEELQGKLVEILTSIQAAAGKASDFAMEQLPDVAQSYVAYGRVSTVLGVLLGAAGVAYAVWAFRRMSRDDTHYSMEPLYGISGAVGGIGGVVIALLSAESALLVWFAPKVWLLKEIATLIK